MDKPSYADGATAKVTVTPPAAGSGYLMIESSDGPLWWQEIDVPAEGKTFDVQLDEKWARHDLYISALVIRPGERKANATPKRAVGVLHLPLDRAERKLALTLQAPQKMRPKQPLTVKFKAANADGSVPKQVHVLLSAVDVGILNITDFKTPDPFASLFGRKAYGADQLDIYGQLIEAGQGRLASLAFGGDAAMAKGGKRPNTTVTIVAQQSLPVTLNEQGEGEATVEIPDFNGELRLMAQAWTDEHFGMAEGKTVVAAPLIAELSAPRFGRWRSHQPGAGPGQPVRPRPATERAGERRGPVGSGRRRPAERQPGRGPAQDLDDPGAGPGWPGPRQSAGAGQRPAVAWRADPSLRAPVDAWRAPRLSGDAQALPRGAQDQPGPCLKATSRPSRPRAWKPAWRCPAAHR